MSAERPRFAARVVEKRWLTSPGTERPTLHVALSIAGAGFAVEPGDTVHVYARNEPAMVDAVMRRLAWSEDARAVLSERVSLGMPSLKLLRAIAERVPDEDEATTLEDLCDDDDALDAYLGERDLLDVLDEHPSASFALDELVRLSPSLQPRTYSVASSRQRHADEVHLTVGIVRWTREGRVRTGVASAFLEGIAVGDMVPLGWQASAHFRLPDEDAPLVCIGPGTGVAPFRGFLQQHRGPIWLLFGARTRAHDFYYRDELEALAAPHRLDVAFSRDGGVDRVYVQHVLRAAGGELAAWIERGAHVYLCGDGTSMAPAVERVVDELLAAGGGLAALKQAKRFHRDVY